MSETIKTVGWAELKALLATGDHHYDPDLLERSPLGLKRYAAVARDFRFHSARHSRRMGAARTHDNTLAATNINFHMPAGQPGSINRFHPFSVEPCLIDASAPPLLYGQAVLIDATTEGARPFASGDQALTDAYGVTVRPFPTQQTTIGTPPLSAALGTAVPPVAGIIDILKSGYVIIGFNASGSAPVKAAQAYIWTASTSGAHIQAGWETANPTTNGCAIGTPTGNGTYYQGGWDASNVGELAFHV